MRILVLRGGALGDFIVTLPALGLLRARWPDARIELVGNVRAAAVALDRHYIDAIHSQHDARWARLGTGALRSDEPLAKWFASFDLVVNFWPDDDGAIARDLERAGFRRVSAGEDAKAGGRRIFIGHPALPERAPAAAHFCDALEPLGLAACERDLCSRVYPNASDRAAATEMLGPGEPPWVAWHPGSGSPRKTWLPERWLLVLAAMRARRAFRLAIALGEAELETWGGAEVERWLPAGTVVLRNLAVPVLAASFERCSFFLGHDSGPAHLAAAAGCRCVLVFGPTDPAMWAPPHEHVRVVRRGVDIAAADVDAVQAALPGW
jgi:heptosyltransferase III